MPDRYRIVTFNQLQVRKERIMSQRNTVVRVALAAGLMAFGVATVAHADTFSACFKNTTQKVRPSSILLNATPVCKTTETLRSWNEQGPQGPSGAQNCAVEEFPGTNQANTFSVTNATCSNGGTAMSGSAIWHTPFDAADNGPFYVYPRGGSVVTVIPWNHTASVQDYRVFVVCCH